jgi:hypothetical protein
MSTAKTSTAASTTTATALIAVQVWSAMPPGPRRRSAMKSATRQSARPIQTIHAGTFSPKLPSDCVPENQLGSWWLSGVGETWVPFE